MNLSNIIKSALQKPISVVVAVLAVLVFAAISLRKMPVDIFPKLGTPTIYVAQTYGGLSPEQIEGYVTSYYEYHFLFVTGIKAVESKTVQGVSLLKLSFNEGTDMSQALGEVVAQVNRARAFMPPGTVSPFVTRFDGGSVAIGQLVFESKTRSLPEIQELALFKVRPMFSTLPGVSAPPPFGGNQRTIVVKADPDKMRAYQMTPEELVMSVAKSNALIPAGNVRIGDQLLITPQNSVVENFKEIENVVVRSRDNQSVFVHDVASVDNGADVTSGYVLINGKRSVYIPVTKRADASTWDVVRRVKAALPDMQAAIPEDIRVSYEFDQSGYVIDALRNLTVEGTLGALLTGIMVLLFLGSWRSALLVVLTIPLSLLAAVVGLSVLGQSINIMTLGGLALAVGILVDEATVTIENIHRYLETGRPKREAIWEACQEIALPKFLILICVLAVFVPAVFMSGIPGALFLPLSLAVGLAMIASFVLSQTFVPVLANWMLRNGVVEQRKPGVFKRFQGSYTGFLERIFALKGILILLSLVAGIGLTTLGYRFLGQEIFPKSDAVQLNVRLRLPDGTRLERTEAATKDLLADIGTLVGPQNVAISSAFVGMQPVSYPVNFIHLWTGGQHEALLAIQFKEKPSAGIDGLKEQIRELVRRKLPGARLSFEPANLVDKVMSQGANNPIEILVQGKSIEQGQEYARRLVGELQKIPYLRDVQIPIPLQTPGLKIEYDRIRLGQLGLTVEEVSRSVVAATGSSRFTQPVFWRDAASGNSFQVQIEFPQQLMNSAEALQLVPVGHSDGKTIYLRDVATIREQNQTGEFDRLNQQRFVPVTANLHGKDLGSSLVDIDRAIAALGQLPAGMKIYQRGQAEVFQNTVSGLQNGLLLALVAILLLLAANFQSFRLALVVLSVLPSVFAGALVSLWLTGQTLNIQSYIGCIMAIGVSVANAILFVANAERHRRSGNPNAGLQGIADRFRPILMTAAAMTAGMIPMSLGMGQGGEQVAPLGIAVIGGLIFSTLHTLIFLPLLYQAWVGKKAYSDVSLFPDTAE